MKKDASCVLVIGARGRGKSTLAKELLKSQRRVIVIDPMAEYARLPAYVRCDTLKAVKDALKKRWNGSFKIAYVPRPPMEVRLHELALLLMHIQKPYFENKDSRQIMLVMEEMNLSFPVTKLPPALYGATMLTLQGRHYGINMMGITQRPAEVSATYRGNCDDIYIFGLSQGLDFRAVSETIGREHETDIRALKPHEFVHWSASGAVRKGKNRLPK